jgi:cell wall-associated NlpC family hydrolase
MRNTTLRRRWPLALLYAAGVAGAQQSEPAAADPLAAFIAERTGAPAWAPTAHRRASELVLAALNFIDTPYVLGGNSHETGFDCSGFTRHIYRLGLGLSLPRRADEQASARDLIAVEREALVPGDLVFFNTLKRAFSHVGIYIGEGRFVHAPRSGSAVRLEDMREAYWARRFDGARRAITLSE